MGSIPACTGDPLEAIILPGNPWVYPRVCVGTLAEGICRGCGCGWKDGAGLCGPKRAGGRFHPNMCGWSRIQSGSAVLLCLACWCSFCPRIPALFS